MNLDKLHISYFVLVFLGRMKYLTTARNQKSKGPDHGSTFNSNFAVLSLSLSKYQTHSTREGSCCEELAVSVSK